MTKYDLCPICRKILKECDYKRTVVKQPTVSYELSDFSEDSDAYDAYDDAYQSNDSIFQIIYRCFIGIFGCRGV